MDDRLIDCYDCQYYVFDVFTGQSYCKYRECQVTDTMCECQVTDTMCEGCRKRKLDRNEGAKNV